MYYFSLIVYESFTHEIGLNNIFNLCVSVLQKRPTVKDAGIVNEYCYIPYISLYDLLKVLNLFSTTYITSVGKG